MGRSASPSNLDFRLLFESVPGLYLVLTPDYHIVAASDAYLRATMTTRERIVGRHLFSVFPDNPADAEATGVSNLSESLARVVRTLRPDAMAVQKYDVRRPDALGGGFEERYWSPLNSPVLGPDGRLRYLVHRVEDVTEYVRLRNDAAAVAALSERASAMEAEILRRAQEIQYANRELRALHDLLEQRVAERTAELERANAALQQEVNARRHTAAALEQTEAQLLHVQRMEAIGLLAGGVAHDFNNLLTAILGYESLAREKLPPGSPVAAELGGIRDAGLRAAELTKQLLTFSRRQIREVRVFDLADVAAQMQPMLARLVGGAIHLRLGRGDEAARIAADRSQIEQVIMNLVLNARDAMPAGGTLTLRIGVAELDAAHSNGHIDVEPGRYAMLAVADTGCGMDEPTLARIFEPFFTTKPPGRGTGLGLSTVYGIVKVSRGSIRVRSEPGAGSTFEVYLPLCGDTPAAEPPAASAASAAAGRAKAGERLLLVEDDEQVRAVASRMLAAAGYEVIPANDPDSALRLARNPDIAFEALVTDVVMPRMNGRQLAELVKAIRPRSRVLFISGYTDDVVLQRGLLPDDVAFVQKPLSAATLASKVRELLDRPLAP